MAWVGGALKCVGRLHDVRMLEAHLRLDWWLLRVAKAAIWECFFPNIIKGA